MIQPTLLINDVCAVEVQEKIAQITIDPAFNVLMWWSYEGIETSIELGPGTWQLIGTTKEITRAQASKIVEQQGSGWKDYNPNNFHHDLPFMSPLDSLNSLLASKGLDKTKNYVLIKKVANV